MTNFMHVARAAAFSLLACASVPMAASASPLADSEAKALKSISGRASWYSMGTRTANGERYNPDGLTAAHRTLAFGTKVRVTNQRNGKVVTVRINDRGPFVGKRVIDLSRGAARSIGMINSGVATVKVEILGRGGTRAAAAPKARVQKAVATAQDKVRVEKAVARPADKVRVEKAAAKSGGRAAAQKAAATTRAKKIGRPGLF